MTTTETARVGQALWEQVDALTKASTRRIDRDADPDVLAEITEPLTRQWGANGVCSVVEYRAFVAQVDKRRTEAVSGHALVPSLWEQAEIALETGREQQAGSGGAPLAQRSPADLDLMEQMLTIRETMPYQLAGRGLIPKGTIPEQIRQLAAHVVSREPQHVDWWAYRFSQWARLLGTYLHAIDNGPRPVRLRNAPCPLCRTRQVTIDTDQGPVVAGPLLVDFVNGWIRAATCTACSATWWRGEELNELRDALETSDPSERIA